MGFRLSMISFPICQDHAQNFVWFLRRSVSPNSTGCWALLLWFHYLYTKQGHHHHNGDQAARRPHMMCSISGRRFATLDFGGRVESGMGPFDSMPMGTWVPAMDAFGSLPICSYISSPLTHMVYRLPFLSYLAGSKSVSAHQPARPTRTR